MSSSPADVSPLAPTLYLADRARARAARRRPRLRPRAARAVPGARDPRRAAADRPRPGHPDRAARRLRRGRRHGRGLGSGGLRALASTSTPRTASSSSTASARRATWLPGELPPDEMPFPVLVKARRGFAARAHLPLHTTPTSSRSSSRYTTAESMVQAFCRGEEFSIDLISDLAGRCLEAVPRSMIESKGGETIKGESLGRRRAARRRGARRRGARHQGPGLRAVLPRRRRPPRDRRQRALRRRVPGARGRGRRLSRHRAGARARREPGAAARLVPRRA